MAIKIVIAGATGKVGRELCRAIDAAEGLELVSGVARSSAGKRVSEVVGETKSQAPIYASLEEALKHNPEVLIDYSAPEVVGSHVHAAIASGVSAVIGTSGLSDQDYEEIDGAARKAGVGVLAAGNFSITAALLQEFATLAAKKVPHWEIFDYSYEGKKDAPSGTTRELAYLLSEVATPKRAVELGETLGPREARGAELNNSLLHSVRLPGFHSGCEIVFGLPGETLSIKHNSISNTPYVEGTLLAARKATEQRGLVRGMNKIINL